jgi:Zn-dependent protease with chaperone function
MLYSGRTTAISRMMIRQSLRNNIGTKRAQQQLSSPLPAPLWWSHRSSSSAACIRSSSSSHRPLLLLSFRNSLIAPWSVKQLQQRQRLIRWTTTVAGPTAAPRQVSSSSSSTRWQRIAFFIRYVRIPALIISVYSLGYQQGVIDCIKEPVALQNQLLQGILVSTGCRDPATSVHVVLESDIRWHSRVRHHQVAAVGHKIVSTAREYVERELEGSIQAVRALLPADVDQATELQAMDGDKTVQFWHQARLRLEGESVVKQPWQYVFIDSPAPNAFVTEILPRRFFITTSMLNVATTPDELAVVLGHEVSHLILGHVSDTNKVETALRTVEVLLLSMDPTAGVISVFVIGLIYAARRALAAAYSRENEMQADDLGVQLAAAACYDTVAGSKVMYKMHQMGTPLGLSKKDDLPADPDREASLPAVQPSVIRLMDTHPPTLDRWERMKHTAENGENYTKHAECLGISQRVFNALWGGSQ